MHSIVGEMTLKQISIIEVDKFNDRLMFKVPKNIENKVISSV